MTEMFRLNFMLQSRTTKRNLQIVVMEFRPAGMHGQESARKQTWSDIWLGKISLLSLQSTILPLASHRKKKVYLYSDVARAVVSPLLTCYL